MLRVTQEAETAFKEMAKEKSTANPIFQIVVMGFG
jgi:hypothetical protein